MRGREKEKRKEGMREGGREREGEKEGGKRERGREGEGDIKINYWLLFSMNCQKELFKIRNVRNFTTSVTIFKRISYFNSKKYFIFYITYKSYSCACVMRNILNNNDSGQIP